MSFKVFNPSINLRYSTGSVEIADVNERIIEIPFVFRAVASLKSGSTVLDVGCAESTVAFSLASLGYQTTGIDLHPYPLHHPNLVTVVSALEDWEGPERFFDAVVSLSSIEHFGLGAYGEPPSDGLDLFAMKKLLTLVKPGGLLVFTAPFGPYELGELQRVYDLPSLKVLLEGWLIQDLQLGVKVSQNQWKIVGGPDQAGHVVDSGKRAVVLLTAYEGQSSPSE